MTTHVEAEIASQPTCWETAAALAADVTSALPRTGERVAVVGCGTSWFMAMSYASLREASGQGLTDAFAASEMPLGRTYDRIVAITRSGTTTEVLELLARERARSGTPCTVLTGVPDVVGDDVSDHVVDLSFADEQSVVQTRFATSALLLLRVSLGTHGGPLVDDVRRALDVPVDDYLDAEQTTFLGRGWTLGLAHEAALKTREAAQFWAEAYPAMDYRHGPIAIAQPGRLVWSFGPPPDGLGADVARTGAHLVTHDLDPLAQLVVAQRLAVGLAERRSLDPDAPRHLTRSVVLR